MKRKIVHIQTVLIEYFFLVFSFKKCLYISVESTDVESRLLTECCCNDHTGQLYCKEQNLLSNMLFMHNC